MSRRLRIQLIRMPQNREYRERARRTIADTYDLKRIYLPVQLEMIDRLL